MAIIDNHFHFFQIDIFPNLHFDPKTLNLGLNPFEYLYTQGMLDTIYSQRDLQIVTP